tara:strand:+ start:373 stop:1173 length:801 start_codon:yes stop_codon:yes gene_type:complete
MNNKILYLVFFFFFFDNSAIAIELNGKFIQGGLIRGKIDPGAKIFLDNNPLKVSKEGLFVFGISKERINDIKINFKNSNEKKEILKKIKKRKFRTQRINGLPSRMVTPNKEDMIRIKKEGKLIKNAKQVNSNTTFFYSKFIKPVSGIITGKYGNQRILNGKPRRAHYGIDIAAKKGTAIIAPASGKITLVKKNLYFTGGTIFIDHGHGVNSIYSHLSSVKVRIGQFVNQGDTIGTVGSTGRSTGPHLDFRIYWKNIPVDPELIITN